MVPTSAQRKLVWAIRHLERLRAEVSEYTLSNAYDFRAEPERVSPLRIDYCCFATERQPPDPDWSLVAGDAVQSMRAVLDHLVWAATPEAKRTTSTAFPIVVDAAKLPTAASRYTDVPAPMKTTIERAQPFRHSPSDPSKDELAILNELAIRDKHHTLVTVVGVVEMELIGATHPTEVEWIEQAAGKTLGSGEQYVSSFRATTPGPPIEEDEIDTSFQVELLIEGHPVDTLVSIARRVYEVVYESETGTPVDPLAPYPII